MAFPPPNGNTSGPPVYPSIPSIPSIPNAKLLAHSTQGTIDQGSLLITLGPTLPVVASKAVGGLRNFRCAVGIPQTDTKLGVLEMCFFLSWGVTSPIDILSFLVGGYCTWKGSFVWWRLSVKWIDVCEIWQEIMVFYPRRMEVFWILYLSFKSIPERFRLI